MPPTLRSAKFTQIYESLPPEAQQVLFEKHLASLLDVIPKDRAKKVVSAAARLRARHAKIPVLDLKGKKREVNSLLDALQKDAKLAFIKERSHRDELLTEVVDSLTSWLSDIWSVVYEYHSSFAQAHSCLLFAADVVTRIVESPVLGGCKCSFLNMAVNVSIKSKAGKTIKAFSLTGPQNITRVLLWIWRDLFVSMMARGSRSEKAKIPDMLVDIESIMGWTSLERLLYGGKSSSFDDDDDDEFDEFDEDGDEESCYEGSDNDDRCPCPLHASHWSNVINNQRLGLRDLIQEHLQNVFAIAPSLKLYNTLIAITPDIPETEEQLSLTLSEIATSTPETFVAALDIHASEINSSQIASLLETHSHLLRPRDAQTLQCAIAVLADSPYHQRSLQILEKEMHDSVLAIRAALRSSFVHMDDKIHQSELAQILQLTPGSPVRRDRVEKWVEAVITTGSPQMHPIAFAAMMMGFPMAPGMEDEEDGDLVSYLDMDQVDPDLEDLREEFRPKLKNRFEGWNETALMMRGGTAVLIKVYTKAVELMPFLRASDAVEEMLNRLGDRPSKSHVCDALDALLSFCKIQRKKLSTRADKKKRSDGLKASTTRNNAPLGAANDAGFSFSFNAADLPSASGAPPFEFPFQSGGLDDVD